MAKVQNLIDDYLNSLNEAMAIHAKKAVENLGFDKTELCEIVNDTNKDKGWYVVWNGSVRYQAYSDNHDYKIGTKVYVKIPNNDYSGQKQITGLYSNGTNVTEYSSTYEMPLNTIQVYKENNLLVDINSSEYGLLANYNKAEHRDGEEVLVLAEINEIAKGYRYLGLAANFKTLLPEMSMGNYGIRLIATLGDGQEQTLALDTADMVGNLYSFSSYIQQQKVFDIYDLDISKIRVEFYQNGNFYNKGERFNGVIDENHYLPDNILTKGLELYYGDYKVTKANELKLSSDSLVYNSSQAQELQNRQINLEWVYTDLETDEDKQESIYIRNYDDIPKDKFLNPKIYWYRNVDIPTVDRLTKELRSAISQRIDNYNLIVNFFDEHDEWKDEDYEENNKKYKIENGTNYIFRENEYERFNNLINNVFNGEQFENDSTGIRYPYYRKDSYTIFWRGLNYLNNLLPFYKAANESDEEYLKLFTNPILGNEWYLIEEPNSENRNTWFSKTLKLDLENSYTKYKVFLEYGPWKTELDDEEKTVELVGEYDKTSADYGYDISEELVFTNEADIRSELEKKQAVIQIVCSDSEDGTYAIYSSTSGNAINPNEPLELKELNVICNQDGEDGLSYLTDSDTIVWEFPTTRTMINVDETCYDDSNPEKCKILDKTDEIFSYYKGVIPYNNRHLYVMYKDGGGRTQNFKVAPKFIRTATDNTVKCYVIQSGGVIIGELPITFTQFSYTGSDYTFSLSLGSLFEKNENNGSFKRLKTEVDNFIELPMADRTYREIEVKLYDIKGREVTLTPEEKNAIMSLWTENDPSGFYCGHKENSDSKIHIEALETSEDNGVSHILRVGIRVDNPELTPAQVAEAGAYYSVPKTLKDFYSIILQANYIRTIETGTEEEPNNMEVAYNQILPLNFKIKHADPSEPYLGLKTLNIQGPNYVVYEHTGGNPKTNPEYSSYNIRSIRNEARSRAIKTYTKNSEAARLNRKKATLLNINDHEDHEVEGKTVAGWDEELKIIKAEYDSAISEIEQEEKMYTGINIPEDDKFGTYGIIILGDEHPRDNYPKLSADGDLLLKREYIDGLNKDICFVLKQKTFYTDINGQEHGITVDLCTMPLAILKNRFSVCGQNVWINNIQLLNEEPSRGRRLLTASANPLIAAGAIVDSAANVTNISDNGKINSVLIGTVLNKNNIVETGLFGYHDNNPVFAVKTDGTAFLGKEGSGRISFDGNSGRITSDAFEQNKLINSPKGTLISLENSEIDLWSNKEDNDSWVHIGANSIEEQFVRNESNQLIYITNEKGVELHGRDKNGNLVLVPKRVELSEDTDTVYFSVNEKTGKRLISIGDIDTTLIRYDDTTEKHRKDDIDYEHTQWGNFFIKTKDFKRPELEDKSDGAGLRIDLSTGNFESYSDFTIMSSDFITFDGKTQITDTLDIFSNTSINGALNIAGSLNFVTYSEDNVNGQYRQIEIGVDNTGKPIYRYELLQEGETAEHKYAMHLNEVKTNASSDLVISSANLGDLSNLDLVIFKNTGSVSGLPNLDNVFIQRKDLNTTLESYQLKITNNNTLNASLVDGLATVATTGNYNDLNNKPDLATVATSGSYDDLSDKPNLNIYAQAGDLAAVALSGDYNDLNNKPDMTNYYSKVEINRLIYALKQLGILSNDWDINTPIPGE